MIEYQKGYLGIPSLFHYYGSVLPRCFVPAMFSGVIVVAIRWIGVWTGDIAWDSSAEHSPEMFSMYGQVCWKPRDG